MNQFIMTPYCGFIIGHHIVDRERISWHNLLYRDYFLENPVFGSEFFRRR
jgi:hypothetical protein